MKRVITVILLTCLFLPLLSLSQLKVVSVDNVFISMDGGNSLNPVYFVIDETNDNVFEESTPGRKLFSENQYNVIRWLIGNGTGTYMIPFNEFNSVNNDLVGVEMEITSAGNSTGYVDFSTYSTPVNNLPLPDGVNTLNFVNNAIPPNGEWVYDRFWMIDALSYGTIPSGEFSFEYSAAEMTGNLFYGSSFLQAQQYDSSISSWGGAAGLLGTDNLSGLVSNITFNPSNFSPYWTLVDQNTPLPIELLKFDVNWNNEHKRIAEIEWVTASETNNDFFEVLRSANGDSWEPILTLDGQGTTTETSHYAEQDIAPLSGFSYYRLKQTDLDGQIRYSSIQSLYKEVSYDEVVIFPNPSTGSFQLNFTNSKKDYFDVVITDNNGRTVKKIRSTPEKNIQVIDISELSTGVFTVSLLQNEFISHTKLIVSPK